MFGSLPLTPYFYLKASQPLPDLSAHQESQQLSTCTSCSHVHLHSYSPFQQGMAFLLSCPISLSLQHHPFSFSGNCPFQYASDSSPTPPVLRQWSRKNRRDAAWLRRFAFFSPKRFLLPHLFVLPAPYEFPCEVIPGTTVTLQHLTTQLENSGRGEGKEIHFEKVCKCLCFYFLPS